MCTEVKRDWYQSAPSTLCASKQVLQGNLVLRNDGKLPRERGQIGTFCRGGKEIPGLCE